MSTVIRRQIGFDKWRINFLYLGTQNIDKTSIMNRIPRWREAWVWMNDSYHKRTHSYFPFKTIDLFIPNRCCHLKKSRTGFSGIIIFLSIFLFSHTSLSQREGKYLDYEEAGMFKAGQKGQYFQQVLNLSNERIKLQKIDSLLNLTDDPIWRSLHPYLLLRTAQVYSDRLEFNKASQYLDQHLSLSQSNQLHQMIAQNYTWRGTLLSWEKKYDESWKSYEKSNTYLTLPDDAITYITNKLYIARIYYNHLGNQEIAETHIKETESLINSYNSHICDQLKLDFYYDCISILKQGTLREKYIKKAVALGYQVADSLFERGEKNKDRYLVYLGRYIKVSTYALLGDTINRVEEMKKLMSITKELNMSFAFLKTGISLVDYYIENENFDEAHLYLKEMNTHENLASAAPEFQLQVYQLNATFFEKNQNYEEAYKYATDYMQLLDSVRKLDVENAFIEAGKKYQTDIALKENKIQQLQLAQQKNMQYVLFALLGLILLVVFYIYYRLHQKKQKAAVLYEKNVTISEQRDQLAHTLQISHTLNQNLEKANQTRDKFLGVLAHDLIHPFNSLLNYTRILQDDYHELSEMQKRDFIQKIYNSSSVNYQLTKELLEWVKSQKEDTIVSKELICMEHLIDETWSPLRAMAQEKQIQTKVSTYRGTHGVHIDKKIIRSILHNLLINSIKFTKAKGQIQIDTYTRNRSLGIAIRDNGVGFENSPNKQSFQKGTFQEKGFGLGLKMVEGFVQLLGGKMKIQSTKGEGTKVFLVIPV